MIRHLSPLRYPGGKGRLSGFVRLLFERNQLLDGHYVEPYAGGAAVGLSLLFLEYASQLYLNDISRPVYLFWKAVLEDTDALCRTIWDRKVTIEEWRRQRQVQRSIRQHSRVDVAYSTFFLNRTSRSGIIKGGGVIGGRGQNGEWKLDARYNKRELIGRIETAAMYSNRIQLFNLDAEAFVERILPLLPAKSLIYLDPPYFGQGHRLYENHYSSGDHGRVARFIRAKLRINWMVSYDNHPTIRRAYSDCKRLTYALPYSAGKRHEGSEVIFFNERLVIPRVTNPLQCS